MSKDTHHPWGNLLPLAWGVTVAQTLLGQWTNNGLSCRILKHLRAKDPMQLRLEHLEQGFSVYVNGANSEQKASPRKAMHPDSSRSASHAEGILGECLLAQA